MMMSENVIIDQVDKMLDRMVNPNLPDYLRLIAEDLHRIASEAHAQNAGDPDTLAGIQKLIEAKDCLIRARLAT